MRVALIDGDEVAYKVALKYQRKIYSVYKEDKLLYSDHLKERAIEYICNEQDLELVSEIEVDDISQQTILEDTLNKVNDITSKSRSSKSNIYLSGDNNFRYELATLKPYKGSRDDSTKPFYLKLTKEILTELGATSIPFLEADDCMSLNSTLIKDCIICSSDKDLKTISSLNYNINKDIIMDISTDMAKYNFFYQLLCGDSVDNIPSPYGLGDVNAKRFLDNTISSDNLITDLKRYYKSYLLKKTTTGSYRTKWYLEQDLDEILYEIGNLLWMRRTNNPDERWTFDWSSY